MGPRNFKIETAQFSCHHFLVVCALFIAAILIGCSPGSSSRSSTPDCEKNYWVATNGDDNNEGSQSFPFKTIDKARLVVRSDPAKGSCAINVNIKSGIYALANTIIFDELDSGSDQYKVIYQSAPGNSSAPIISGGIPVNFLSCSGGTCTSATIDALPDQLMPRQFYVNDNRAVRARSNYDPALLNQASNLEYVRVSNGYAPASGQSPAPLTHPEWAEVVTTTQWKMMRCPINSAQGSTLVVASQCWNNANTYPEPWNFQLLSWIENAPEYLTQPNMWFLNPSSKKLQYIPPLGSTTLNGILPVLEVLISLSGQERSPVTNITFKGLQFSYATWYGPNTIDGYVSDQSGNYLKGSNYTSNAYGHQKVVFSTPGNINAQYAKNIIFDGNIFSHLGGVGLMLGRGSRNNLITNNTFTDISSAAIQIGGVSEADLRPDANSLVSSNQIINNDISYTGRDYYDTAGIYVGFTAQTLIKNNSISHTPWSGIAIGWGWGLFDIDGFPGLPHANWNEWGSYSTPTIMKNNQIISNKISYFLEQLWDGGAIYANGSQGNGYADGLLLQLNVAQNKRGAAGSNIFYTDGGTQFITLDRNVSLNNPVGYFDFGACTPSTWPSIVSWANIRFCEITPLRLPYGAEMGGCVSRGYITYTNNYFTDPTTFYDVCTNYLAPGIPSTTPYIIKNNIQISSAADVPSWIIQQAGKQ